MWRRNTVGSLESASMGRSTILINVDSSKHLQLHIQFIWKSLYSKNMRCCCTCELKVAVDAGTRPIQLAFWNGGGRFTSPSLYHRSTDRGWLLGEGDSGFFKGGVPSRSTTLQLIGPHTWEDTEKHNWNLWLILKRQKKTRSWRG